MDSAGRRAFGKSQSTPLRRSPQTSSTSRVVNNQDDSKPKANRLNGKIPTTYHRDKDKMRRPAKRKPREFLRESKELAKVEDHQEKLDDSQQLVGDRLQQEPELAPEQRVRVNKVTPLASQTQLINIDRKINSRSRKLTLCLILLAAAVSCLSHFIGEHIIKRIGLLLFEAELIRLQSSYFTVILAALILVTLSLLIGFSFNFNRKKLINSDDRSTIFQLNNENSLLIQRISKQLISLFALISGVCFLGLGLMVPHVKQIQRMPVATFDCNANLISIENCRQQFVDGELTLTDALLDLLVGKPTTKTPLNKRLNCLQFRATDSVKQPTRFLLYHCNLVCRPQRQQLHQFGDDLNGEPGSQPEVERPRTKLVPPYQRQQDDELLAAELSPLGERSLNFRNGTRQAMGEMTATSRQVSIKICFSGEPAGGQSSYKQFCITNLANQQHPREQPMTVGQFNAMLRGPAVQPDDPITSRDLGDRPRDRPSAESQSTSYVNPVVQFESHFNAHSPARNQPTASATDSPSGGTCNFRPIPPFIVNNKPFNEIQCSLEHEYTMSTGPSLDYLSSGGLGPQVTAKQPHQLNDGTLIETATKIYLKRVLGEDQLSVGSQPNDQFALRDRCNIQCKVNILYQIQLTGTSGERENQDDREQEARRQDGWTNSRHYYLPLRPCVVVTGSGDLVATSSRYLLFRSLGETSLTLTLILIDLMLLVECRDTRRSPLESRRTRSVGLLMAVLLIPLVVGLAFDLAARWWPQSTGWPEVEPLARDHSKVEEPSLGMRLATIIASLFTMSHGGHKNFTSSTDRPEPEVSSISSSVQSMDAFLVPLFAYATLMFALAVSSWTLEPVSVAASQARVASMSKLSLLVEGNPEDEPPKDAPKSIPKAKASSLILLSLFLGVQFSLSQSLASKILGEAFSSPGDGQGPDDVASFTATWFIASTSSTGALVSLVIVLIFASEISTLFAGSLRPFKTLTSGHSSEDRSRGSKNEAGRFLWIVSLVILVYALRFWALSQVSRGSRLKWLLAFIYQLGELFCFPIAWLALTTRLHELIAELYADSSKRGSQVDGLDAHLLGRLVLALIYFGLSRYLALLAHSLQISIQMHSEDVDWFVASFYGLTGSRSGANRTASDGTSAPVFSPLPGDELTYQHASVIFIKFNALLCLLVGVYLLVGRLRVQLAEWAARRAERQRLLADAAARRARQRSCEASDPTSESLDERLSLDLMRIHASKQPATLTIYPTSGPASAPQPASPRAKILFHYNTSRGDPTIAGQGPPQSPTTTQPSVQLDTAPRLTPTLETRDPTPSRGEQSVGQHLTTERRISHKSRRVKIFEDEEIWPAPDEAESGHRDDGSTSGDLVARTRGRPVKTERRITFAPKATLINGQAEGRRKLRNNSISQPASGRKVSYEAAKRASPELSIGGMSNDDDYNGEREDPIEVQDSIEAQRGTNE